MPSPYRIPLTFATLIRQLALTKSHPRGLKKPVPSAALSTSTRQPRTNIHLFVRFEVFTALTMKNAVFWDVAPCRSCVSRSFGGTYSLHLKSSHLLTLVPRSRIFYHDDRSDTFLRNVGSRKIYTAPHPRRRHSSFISLF
jgi:hypothetical protein